jgi:hypothetical protein
LVNIFNLLDFGLTFTAESDRIQAGSKLLRWRGQTHWPITLILAPATVGEFGDSPPAFSAPTAEKKGGRSLCDMAP